MMKFTIDAKELKEMMEKAMTTINKKSPIPSLTKLCFEVDAEDMVKITGTNLEHFVEVTTDNVFDLRVGAFGIDIEDVKVLTKMTGLVTFEDISTETEMKINVKCGKKTLTIPKYENVDVFLPCMDDTEMNVLSLKENWLIDTVSKLKIYTDANNANRMLNVFHFNTKDKRVEALEGHKIGMRKMESDMILSESKNPFETIKLHKMCVPVFKKIMDKKSDNVVIVSQDKKHIKFKGNDFTYITRRIDGEFFKTDQVLNFSSDYRIIVNRDKFLEVMKYNTELEKINKDAKRKPVVLYSKNGNLYSYIETYRYEAFDELETEVNTMKDDFCIGFNPQYLAEAFNIVDSDEPVCIGTNPKAPMVIKGNEYSFLILPVSLTGTDLEIKARKHVENGKVA